MRYIVKLNCHDWPHRGDMSKREVAVDAGDDTEAMALGMIQAKQTWPGAKLKIFDVVVDRLAKFAAENELQRGDAHPILEAVAASGIMETHSSRAGLPDGLMLVGEKNLEAMREVMAETPAQPAPPRNKLGLRPA